MRDVKAYKKAWYEANKERLAPAYANYRKANKEKIKAYLAQWAKDNRAKSNALKRKWAKNNPEKDSKAKTEYSKAHPEKRRIATARRRARRLHATPKWLSNADRKAMVTFYANTPKGYEVDHIVPLQGETVRGLHVPWNLQYLTIKQNRAKKNKLDFEITAKGATLTEEGVTDDGDDES